MSKKDSARIWPVVFIVFVVLLGLRSCGTSSTSDSGVGGSWIRPDCIRCDDGWQQCNFCINGWVNTTYNDGYACGVCGGRGKSICTLCGGSGSR